MCTLGSLVGTLPGSQPSPVHTDSALTGEGAPQLAPPWLLRMHIWL